MNQYFHDQGMKIPRTILKNKTLSGFMRNYKMVSLVPKGKWISQK